MRRANAGRSTAYPKARSIGAVAALVVLSTGIGGLFGRGLSECPSPFPSALQSVAIPDSPEAKKLESLRRSRLAFLNLGLDRKSRFIESIAEEIAIAECRLKTFRVARQDSMTESDAIAELEAAAPWRPVGSKLGSILGFVLGAIGAAIYGWKRQEGKKSSPGGPEGVSRRIQIPVLGTIPEGAFKER